jgi:hypothetical protein
MLMPRVNLTCSDDNGDDDDGGEASLVFLRPFCRGL